VDKTFTLLIQFESDSPLTLSMPGRTTMQELKMNVSDIKSIPVRHQEWTGWPNGCNNDTTLAVGLNSNALILLITNYCSVSFSNLV